MVGSSAFNSSGTAWIYWYSATPSGAVTFLQGKYAEFGAINLNSINFNQLAQVLDSEQQQVIDLFMFRNLTPQEVAERLNIPVETEKNLQLKRSRRTYNFYIPPVRRLG